MKQIVKVNDLTLNELLNYVVNYKICYRDNIGLDKKITFGVEIEYEDAKTGIYRFVNKNVPTWECGSDVSLHNGGEIRSNIMTDKKENWDNIRKVCQFTKKHATTNRGCAGGHIHIGANIINYDYDNLIKFLKCYVLYEDILSRFLCGDKINIRRSCREYAKIASYYLNRVICNEREFYNCGRYLSLNLGNLSLNDKKPENNTLEFRRPNGTLEEVIWQNNINVLTKMILSSISNDLDIDFINYKYKQKMENSVDEVYFNEIDLQKAIEFMNIFLKTDIDKLNFLTQYVKDYDISGSSDSLILSKRFWK